MSNSVTSVRLTYTTYHQRTSDQLRDGQSLFIAPTLSLTTPINAHPNIATSSHQNNW